MNDPTDLYQSGMNCNFDYDYQACAEVKRDLGSLIAAGWLPLAMQLSLELMKQGSHQVEVSDEGMMTQDIEDCLALVFIALKKCGLSGDQDQAQYAAMLANDRVRIICRKPLESLQQRLQVNAVRW
jgi:hypothetical protein